jgi:hypothetical protein
LSVAATVTRSSTLCLLRSVPLGKYWRSRPWRSRWCRAAKGCAGRRSRSLARCRCGAGRAGPSPHPVPGQRPTQLLGQRRDRGGDRVPDRLCAVPGERWTVLGPGLLAVSFHAGKVQVPVPPRARPTTLHSCWPARPKASTNRMVLVAQHPYPSTSALRPGGDRGHGASLLSVTLLAGRHRPPAAHCTAHSPAHRSAGKCQVTSTLCSPLLFEVFGVKVTGPHRHAVLAGRDRLACRGGHPGPGPRAAASCRLTQRLPGFRYRSLRRLTPLGHSANDTEQRPASTLGCVEPVWRGGTWTRSRCGAACRHRWARSCSRRVEPRWAR